MSAFFSIIIPTLNEEHYLPRLLSDIESQVTKDYEVIVVDAQSEDKTEEIAQGYAKKMSLQFIVSPKKNVSCQRNLGATHATGEYLVFLDADVRVQKDFLTHIKVATKRKNQGIFLPFMLPDDQSQKTKAIISFVNTLIRLSQLYGKPLAPGGNLIVQKDIFEKVGGFSEDVYLSEDHDFVRRAYRMGYKAKILRGAKLQMSMRRSKVEGDMSLIYKYIIAFLMYTMTSGKSGLQKKVFDYEMGGQKYVNLDLKEKESLKKKLLKIKRLNQLNDFLLALRYFNKV